MPTPMHLKPALARWIVTERKRLGLKPKDVADRLHAMGLDVSEATVKVWESNVRAAWAAACPDGLGTPGNVVSPDAQERGRPPEPRPARLGTRRGG
jgi:hypothetical protein